MRHGESNSGRHRQTPEYRSWIGMKERCYNPANQNFADYGGRGIVVSEKWLHSFEAFLADMGRRPSPLHTLDRRNNDGPYDADNCRWATPLQQARNSRQCRLDEMKVRAIRVLVEAGFVQKEIAKWFGVHPNRITAIKNGRAWADVEPRSRSGAR